MKFCLPPHISTITRTKNMHKALVRGVMIIYIIH